MAEALWFWRDDPDQNFINVVSAGLWLRPPYFCALAEDYDGCVGYGRLWFKRYPVTEIKML